MRQQLVALMHKSFGTLKFYVYTKEYPNGVTWCWGFVLISFSEEVGLAVKRSERLNKKNHTDEG